MFSLLLFHHLMILKYVASVHYILYVHASSAHPPLSLYSSNMSTFYAHYDILLSHTFTPFSPFSHLHTHTLSPQVQAPPGTVIGYVNQDALGILHPWFSITNTEGETVLKIKGPFLGCSCCSDTNFEVGGALFTTMLP